MNKTFRTGLVTIALTVGTFFGAQAVNAQVDTVPADDTVQPADEPVETDTPAPADTGDTTGTARPERGERGERGQGHRGGQGQHGDRGDRGEAIAELLGIDTDTLRAAIEEGQTLADIATANGVDPQTVIDAQVAEQTEWINAAVESERLTAEQAAERLDDVVERVTARVNEGRPEGAEREGRGGRGHCDDDAATADDAAAGDVVDADAADGGS